MWITKWKIPKNTREAGPNMYNRDGYLKWGIYKPGWKQHPELTNVTERMVWHDNIRIGFSTEMVDPDRF